MTSTICVETLKTLDKKFCYEKREVALIINNHTAHTEFKVLKTIKIVYMPPNPTSVLQPLKKGVVL